MSPPPLPSWPWLEGTFVVGTALAHDRVGTFPLSQVMIELMEVSYLTRLGLLGLGECFLP